MEYKYLLIPMNWKIFKFPRVCLVVGVHAFIVTVSFYKLYMQNIPYSLYNETPKMQVKIPLSFVICANERSILWY